jgi:hypothetical protein
MKQAKAVMIATKPLEAARNELLEVFARDGDEDDIIYLKLQLLDSVWKHFMIAIDNAKE